MDTLTGFYTTGPLTTEQCVGYLRRQAREREGVHARASDKVADRLAALAAENERLKERVAELEAERDAEFSDANIPTEQEATHGE